jgi:hypothetical protein
VIESKSDARARGVSSPDIADALMLAFARYEGPLPIVDWSINQEFWRPNPWRVPYEGVWYDDLHRFDGFD